jgi:alpha-tubulin suppressor-like RCC1 family protein
MNFSFNLINTGQKNWSYMLLLLFITSFVNLNAQQCGFNYVAGDGCSNTNYANFGFYSNNDPATIEYDNIISAFHATIVRNSNGSFSVWGDCMANDGTASVLTPQEVNSNNYPALGSHKVLKATLASNGVQQTILLTSDGLYTWGLVGQAFNSTLKSTPAFGRVANTNGSTTSNLPPGVTPADVKMLTASSSGLSTGGNIILTTCRGEVWALATDASVRGDGPSPAITNNLSWSQVKKSAGVPLTNIVAARINRNFVIALDSNNTLWTWGTLANVGDNTNAELKNYATQMVHPDATKNIKMIGVTSGFSELKPSYYVLMTDGNMYSLGVNTSRQLGDWSNTERRSWIQPRYNGATGLVMNNIKWISPQENDENFAAINVITNNGNLYAWGYNNYSMLGSSTIGTLNPFIPSGLSSSDKIIAVETGGHTSMIIKECSSNFGYAGHSIRGSMANGIAADAQTTSYTFATAPVNICGASSINLTINVQAQNLNGDYCTSSSFLLSASPSGGTFSVVSGSANINSSNIISFSGSGTVVISYTLPSSGCVGSAAEYALTVVDCCPVLTPISN